MKGKLSKIILLGYIIINILIPISVSAESLKSGNFEKLSIDEGLSNEYVTSIFQDSKGYMWIGTIDGLNRYDGERIKVYNCSVDRENSLSSTYINAIEEDSRGNIWVGTDLGLDIIDRNTDSIVRFNDLKIDGPKLSNLKITSLLKIAQSARDVNMKNKEYAKLLPYSIFTLLPIPHCFSFCRIHNLTLPFLVI